MSTIIDSVISIPDIFFLIAEHFDDKSWINARGVCRLWKFGFDKLCKYLPYALALGQPLCDVSAQIAIMHAEEETRGKIVKAAAALNPTVYLDALRVYLSREDPVNMLKTLAVFAKSDPAPQWHAKMLKNKLDIEPLMRLEDDAMDDLSDDEISLLYGLMDRESAIKFTMTHPSIAGIAMSCGVEAWEAYANGCYLRCPEMHDHEEFIKTLAPMYMWPALDWKYICQEHKALVLSSDLQFASNTLKANSFHRAFFSICFDKDVSAYADAFRRNNLSFSIRRLTKINKFVSVPNIIKLYEFAPDLVDRKHNRRYLRVSRNPRLNPLRERMGMRPVPGIWVEPSQ